MMYLPPMGEGVAEFTLLIVNDHDVTISECLGLFLTSLHHPAERREVRAVSHATLPLEIAARPQLIKVDVRHTNGVLEACNQPGAAFHERARPNSLIGHDRLLRCGCIRYLRKRPREHCGVTGYEAA
jgi:hypothetical protein